MMMQSFLRKVFVAMVILGTAACQSPRQEPIQDNHNKVLLAVFAHPDDEATVAPVLAKYAAEGVKVYLATATDGRLGVAAHAGIPAGDSLATIRTGELKCSAEKLGIEPPTQFGLEDQLKMGEGMAAFNGQLDTLRQRVHQLFVDLKPDVVLTWNASGWTGHHDHRLVGAVVTEVFESQHWDKPSQLYYAAIPTGALPKNSPMQLATVDSSYLTVKVSVSDTDFAKAKEAWLCHKSQYTPDQIDMMMRLIQGSLKHTAYFQPFIPVEGERHTLF